MGTEGGCPRIPVSPDKFDTGATLDTIDRLNAALEGRYRIQRELGAGGMATVYLADDLRHDRPVALKVLRPELAAMMGAERFLGEIRTTANLQHPHILPLFDSGEADGFLFYVMPYVSGESLRDRLNREKQLPVEEAVRLTRAIAGALDYAHRQGVIHRDIKPANILLHDDQPLVADFGIALAVQQAGGGRLTETGLSLGTPYYMSPEQATGDRDPDARSDLYSLGCVAYEMLVGEPPFSGATAQSVLAKILTGEAPLVTEARKAVPPHVASAVARATQRLPADRFATSAEFSAALGDTAYRFGSVAKAAGGGTAGGDRPAGSTPWKLASGALAVLSLVLAALWQSGSGPGGPTGAPLHLYVAMPDSQQVMASQGGPSIRLSADGATMVYTGPSPDGLSQLWVKRRGELEATPLRNTADPEVFMVSPDGSEVAFVLQASPSLLVMPTAGGTVRTLADSAGVAAGDWGPDGFVYFQNRRSGISRVPAVGGPVEHLTDPADGATGDHTWIDVLPGGRLAVMTRWGNSAATDSILVLELGTGEIRDLVQGVNARYLPTGHLVVASNDGTLSVAPFDSERGILTGPLRAITDGVRAGANGELDFDVSDSGTLVYLSGNSLAAQPVWVDREGGFSPVQPGWVEAFESLALSPDGSRLAVVYARGGRSDLWVKRLDQADAPPQRLTFQEWEILRPAWLPGGDTVLVVAAREVGRRAEILAKKWDGTGEVWAAVDSTAPGAGKGFQGISVASDGSWIVYRAGGGTATRDIFGLETATGEVVPLVAESFNEHSPALSPDVRWLAYVSNESGREEVYVRPFPEVNGGKWLVSTEGGAEPAWSPDARELYYRDSRGMLVAARLGEGNSFSVAGRRSLFSVEGFVWDPVHAQYAVHPDGERFLMLRLLEDGTSRVAWIEDFASGLVAAGDAGR